MSDRIRPYVDQLERLLDFPGVGWWLVDRVQSPDCFYCNDRLRELFGLDSMPCLPIQDCFPLSNSLILDALTADADLLGALLDATPSQHIHPDPANHRDRVVQSYLKALEQTETGAPAILLGLIVDVTEQECASSSEDERTMLLDEYLISLRSDGAGSILEASQATCDLTGYGKDELIGATHRLVTASGLDALEPGELWSRVQLGETWIGELGGRRSTGEEYWLDCVARPHTLEQGVFDGFTLIAQDITEKKSLERISERDKLTGLYNRHKLESILSHERERNIRYATNLSLIILDVDHFKRVNDTHGHQVGDRVLQQFAHILQKNVRIVDVVGRWGGEEFIVICPESRLAAAQAVANKLCKMVREFPFDTVGSKTASFGLASIRQGESIDSLIARADRALYRAKTSGRNRVELSR